MGIVDNLYRSDKYPSRFAFGLPGNGDTRFVSDRAIVLLDDRDTLVLQNNDQYLERVMIAALTIFDCGDNHSTMFFHVERYVRKFRSQHAANR